jgi:hypothetical protein
MHFEDTLFLVSVCISRKSMLSLHMLRMSFVGFGISHCGSSSQVASVIQSTSMKVPACEVFQEGIHGPAKEDLRWHRMWNGGGNRGLFHWRIASDAESNADLPEYKYSI